MIHNQNDSLEGDGYCRNYAGSSLRPLTCHEQEHRYIQGSQHNFVNTNTSQIASSSGINLEHMLKSLISDLTELANLKLSDINIVPKFAEPKILNECLLIASVKGDENVMKTLLSQGADVNYQNNDGYTPLMAASQGGHLSSVKIIIKYNPLLERKSKGGRTALSFAAGRNHLEVLEFLLQNGADVDCVDNEGHTPLFVATALGETDTIKILLKHKAKVNFPDKLGVTPLMIAAHGNRIDTVELLLENNADVNVSCGPGITALSLASMNDHIVVEKLLIEHGADKQKSVQTNLFNFCYEGNPEKVRKLLMEDVDVNVPYYDGHTLLMAACQNGHLSIAEMLISKGANVNQKNNEGLTAIYYCIIKSHIDILKYLVESAHADLECQDVNGLTPLLQCTLRGNLDILIYLLSQNIAIHHTDGNGNSAVCLAARQGHLQILRVLHEKGGNLNDRNNTSVSPFYLAAINGHVEMVNWLLSADLNCDVNQQDSLGQTALFQCSLEGNFKMIKLLIENNANVNLTDRQGRTALMAAAQKGDVAIIKYLIENGAVLSTKSNDGETAISFAAYNTQNDALTLLLSYCDEKEFQIEHAEVKGLHLLKYSTIGDATKVKEELERGANINFQDPKGTTPLMAACKSGHYDIVEILLQHNAAVDMEDKDKLTALFHYLSSCKARNTGVSRKDITVSSSPSPSSVGQDVLSLLIKYEANVDHKNNDGVTPLMMASNLGYLNIAKQLVESGARIDAIDSKGMNAANHAYLSGEDETLDYLITCGLYVNKADLCICFMDEELVELMNLGDEGLLAAVKDKDLTVVEHLLELNLVSVNCTFDNGMTALMTAASKGRLSVVRALLQHGADIYLTDKDGMDALFHAVLMNETNVVKYLLENGSVSVINREIRNFKTPILIAVAEGNLDTIRVLTDFGADVNYPVIYNETYQYRPLNLACEMGNLMVVKLLVSRGASYQWADSSYRKAKDYALENGHKDIVEWLQMCENNPQFPKTDTDINSKEDILFFHVSQNNENEVKILLNEGVEVDSKDSKGNTPLCVSSRDNYSEEMIKFLLDRGANVNHRNNKGMTPLMLSVQNGHIHIVNLLLSLPVHINLNEMNGKGMTALLIAVSQNKVNQTKIMHVLLNAGVDVNATVPSSGSTALHIATAIGKIKFVKMLIAKGALPDKPDLQGRTALHVASMSGNSKAVVVLINDLGTTVNSRDKHGQTPLMLSAAMGNIDALEVLLNKYSNDKQLNVNERDWLGNTALMLACNTGVLPSVTKLLSHGADVKCRNREGFDAFAIALKSQNSAVVDLVRPALEKQLSKEPMCVEVLGDSSDDDCDDLTRQDEEYLEQCFEKFQDFFPNENPGFILSYARSWDSVEIYVNIRKGNEQEAKQFLENVYTQAAPEVLKILVYVTQESENTFTMYFADGEEVEIKICCGAMLVPLTEKEAVACQKCTSHLELLKVLDGKEFGTLGCVMFEGSQRWLLTVGHAFLNHTLNDLPISLRKYQQKVYCECESSKPNHKMCCVGNEMHLAMDDVEKTDTTNAHFIDMCMIKANMPDKQDQDITIENNKWFPEYPCPFVGKDEILIKKGKQVIKYGAKTGYTVGKIIQANASWFVSKRNHKGTFVVISATEHEDTKGCTPCVPKFADDGDSGSVVFDAKSGVIFGVVFARNDKFQYYKKQKDGTKKLVQCHAVTCIRFNYILDYIEKKFGVSLKFNVESVLKIVDCSPDDIVKCTSGILKAFNVLQRNPWEKYVLSREKDTETYSIKSVEDQLNSSEERISLSRQSSFSGHLLSERTVSEPELNSTATDPAIDTPFHFVAANEVDTLIELLEKNLSNIKEAIVKQKILDNVENLSARDLLLTWKRTNREWKEFWEILRDKNLEQEMELLETAYHKEQLLLNFDLLRKYNMLGDFISVYYQFHQADNAVVAVMTTMPVRLDTSDQLIQLLCSICGPCINQFYQTVAESTTCPDGGSNILQNIALVPDRYNVPRSVSC